MPVIVKGILTNGREAMRETEGRAGSVLSLKHSLGHRTETFSVTLHNTISPSYYTTNSWREEGTEYLLEH